MLIRMKKIKKQNQKKITNKQIPKIKTKNKQKPPNKQNSSFPTGQDMLMCKVTSPYNQITKITCIKKIEYESYL